MQLAWGFFVYGPMKQTLAKSAKALSELRRAHERFTTKREALEEIIKPLAEFETGIVVHESDGVCVISIDSANVLSIGSFLAFVKEHGPMTAEQFDRYSV